MKKRGLFMIPIGLLAIAGFGFIVMLLWNWLIPGIFGLTAISFWQALGLLALSRIFFGGFSKMRGGMHGRKRDRMNRDKNAIREKWLKMTPEERKEFVKRRHHFNHDCFEQETFDAGCFDINDQATQDKK